MTVNLSFAEHQRPTRGIEHFYTDLHDAMSQRGSMTEPPFPSAQEFKQFLARAYPQGLGRLRCLDAGCGGTAINSRTLVRARASRVLAVDLNHASLQLVRQSLPHRNNGLSLACGSVLHLPFPPASFDFVVCSGVVHHTPNPEQALRELRCVMRPHARLYVSVYCFEGSLMLSIVKLWRLAARVVPFSLMHRVFRRSSIVNDFVLDHMYVPNLWVYRTADFTTLLERCGFAIEETFVSALDHFHGRTIGPWSVTGDGLLRVFLCRPAFLTTE
jgi:2-polyprenyl-3-methyl-5-hydroxy-6-metoxy-1,4-benzoquinol methylase